MKEKKSNKKVNNGKTPAKKARQKAPVRAPSIPATIIKPCEAPPKTVPVLIRTKFYGNVMETQQVMRIPLVENDTIRLDMTIDLRKSEFIEIRPIRRQLGDVAGMLEDAQALANDVGKPT
jgi:hypothetical protein